MEQLSLVSPIITTPRPAQWQPAALPEFELPDLLGFDTEGTGLRWWDGDLPTGMTISYWDGDQIVSNYYGWGHADGNIDPEQARRWCRDKLRNKRLTGLNLGYDAHMMYQFGVDLEALGNRLSDVGHYAALLDDHRTSFSLEALSNDYLGIGKVRGLDLSGGAHVYPTWQIEEYAKQDGRLPLWLLKKMDAALSLEDLLRVRDLEDKVNWARLTMERNGARLDLDALERYAKETKAKLDKLYREIINEAGFALNPGSRDSMTRLFRQRGYVSPKRTEPSNSHPEGQPSYDDSVLKLFADHDPLIAKIRVASGLESLRSKFIVPYLESAGRTGILRFALHQLRATTDEGGEYGTVSGRFSSAQPIRGEGANIQQVMSVEKQTGKLGNEWIIRALFIPEHGLRTVASDAKQIEYRIFAHLSQSARLIQMYRDDPETDFHAEVDKILQAHGSKMPRKKVKMVNFGRLFGAGKDKITELMGVELEEGIEFLKEYDRNFPEAKATLNAARKVAKERGYVRTILGRRCRFPPDCYCPACNGRQRWHKALNAADQGSAADVMKTKVIELHERRKEIGLIPRMTVHDEYVGDVPDAEAAAKVDAVLNEQSLPFSVPILWSTKHGANWAACA